VKQVRNGVTESVHRGDVVEVDVAGRMLHVIGDPERVVNLRSTVKPFGLLALLRAGGRREFDLTDDELALMASSHSGEDLHVRTIQALYRRLTLPTALIQTGTEGSPLDELTAARLARDGERPSVLRHMCSGQHTVYILLAKLGGWPLEGYWEAEHPASKAYAEMVATVYGVRPDRLVTGIDGCGILTYAFRLREVARAYAILAGPDELPADDPRAPLVPHLVEVRDAMRRHPELVGGTRDRLDTSLVKALDGRVVSKSGVEALRGIGVMRGPRGSNGDAAASGIAVKIEDGDGHERATWSASVEALRQVGVAEGQALRALARYHRPVTLDPHGRTAAEAVPEFELAPVGELLGQGG
jgi:L-asparaginase II